MTTNHRPDSVDARRRWLAAGVAVPALAWIGGLHAQEKPPALIGWLSAFNRESDGLREPFNEGMAALGWKLGTHYVLEERHAQGRVERLPALAQELAASKPMLVVASTSATVQAMVAAAPAMPIVIASGDPLATGLVTNLARPGGLITGVSNQSSAASVKVVELLVECMPKLRRVGFLVDSSVASRGAANTEAAHRAAKHSRVAAVIAEMASPDDIEPALARLAKSKAEALVLMSSNWFSAHLPTIIALAMAQRWPVAGTLHNVAAQGGLLSFGADSLALARRSASYVDRILKGAKPGDLPIEQPTAFRFVLNMKTAKALGLTIPSSVLLRTTEMIE